MNYVYMMASLSRVIYVGVTNNLLRRVWEHKEWVNDGFTKKYKCKKLVWFEESKSIEDAILREKQIKRWRRDKKIKLIEIMNHWWNDLAENMQ